MSSVHEQTVPVYTRLLRNLLALLDKAEDRAAEKGFEPAVLVNAGLAPDMLPLARQVMILTDQAKGTCGRLAGVEIPKFDDIETTLPELKARVVRTLDFIAGLKPDQFEGAAGKPIHIKLPSVELDFIGQRYLSEFALPNFYFHLSVAYAILRHNGVAIGKFDYLGSYD